MMASRLPVVFYNRNSRADIGSKLTLGLSHLLVMFANPANWRAFRWVGLNWRLNMTSGSSRDPRGLHSQASFQSCSDSSRYALSLNLKGQTVYHLTGMTAAQTQRRETIAPLASDTPRPAV